MAGVKKESGKGKKVEKKDTVEIPVGKYFSNVRENPWIVASVVLAILFVGSLFFSFGGGVASEQEVENNVLGFLNSRIDGEVTLQSIEWNTGGYYEVVVEYQGDAIPFFVTSDGESIITDLVRVNPIDSFENLVEDLE